MKPQWHGKYMACRSRIAKNCHEGTCIYMKPPWHEKACACMKLYYNATTMAWKNDVQNHHVMWKACSLNHRDMEKERDKMFWHACGQLHCQTSKTATSCAEMLLLPKPILINEIQGPDRCLSSPKGPSILQKQMHACMYMDWRMHNRTEKTFDTAQSCTVTFQSTGLRFSRMRFSGHCHDTTEPVFIHPTRSN